MRPLDAFGPVGGVERVIGRGVLVLSNTVNARVRGCGLARRSFENSHFHSIPKVVGNGGSVLGVAHPSIVSSVCQHCLGTNTSVVATGAFSYRHVSRTSCRLRSYTERVTFRNTHLTHVRYSGFSAPSGPHFITKSIKPAGGAYSVDPSIDTPTTQRVACSRLFASIYRRISNLVRNNTSIVLVRAVFSALGYGTVVSTTVAVVGGRKMRLPVVVDLAIDSLTNEALDNRAISTFLTSLSPCPVFSMNVGYTFNTPRVGPFVRRLTGITPCCVDTRPGTKLPGRVKRCSRATRSVTPRVTRFVSRNVIGVVNNYYKADPRFVTRCTEDTRKGGPRRMIRGPGCV